MTFWNDTDTPLAYLITVRTYGTWLHGDDRGSVDRFMNKYGSPRIPRRDTRKAYNSSIMKGEPVLLDALQRSAVDEAVREVCEHKGLHLHAINVRTNHFHAVPTAITTLTSGQILNALKSYATRKMRERGLWGVEHTPWVDKGSVRWLWNERSLFYACDYVLNGQGCDLIDFDTWKQN